MLEWTILTALSGMLGAVLPGFLLFACGIFNSPGYYVGDSAIFPLSIWIAGLVITLGLALGWGQARVLRRIFDPRIERDWRVVTVEGVVIGTAVSVLVVLLAPSWGWIVVGMVLGVAQMIVLDRYLEWEAGWWFFMTAVAGAAGALCGLLVLGALPRPAEGFAFPFYPLAGVVNWLVATAIGMLVYGLLTGAGLVGLLRRQERLWRRFRERDLADDLDLPDE